MARKNFCVILSSSYKHDEEETLFASYFRVIFVALPCRFQKWKLFFTIFYKKVTRHIHLRC
jgi:hypothetical protein